MMYTDKSTVEIIKEIVMNTRHFGPLTIEITDSVMRDTGTPVFRVAIEKLNIESEEPLEKAVREVKTMVYHHFDIDDEAGSEIA